LLLLPPLRHCPLLQPLQGLLQNLVLLLLHKLQHLDLLACLLPHKALQLLQQIQLQQQQHLPLLLLLLMHLHQESLQHFLH
jgi:hypothetical protein